MTCCEHAGSNLQDLKARTQDIVEKVVVQIDSQRKFERLTKKPTEQFEQGTVQSSTGGTAMVAGRPAPKDSQMLMAAVAESATTQSTTSSTIRVKEIEEPVQHRIPEGAGKQIRSARNHCGHGHVRSDRSDDRFRRL